MLWQPFHKPRQQTEERSEGSINVVYMLNLILHKKCKTIQGKHYKSTYRSKVLAMATPIKKNTPPVVNDPKGITLDIKF